MGWQVALKAKVAGAADNSPPEMMLPNPIDHNPCGCRVVLGGNPFRQSPSSAGRFVCFVFFRNDGGLRSQNRRKGRADFLSLERWISPAQYVRGVVAPLPDGQNLVFILLGLVGKVSLQVTGSGFVLVERPFPHQVFGVFSNQSREIDGFVKTVQAQVRRITVRRWFACNEPRLRFARLQKRRLLLWKHREFRIWIRDLFVRGSVCHSGRLGHPRRGEG